ncbi:hypothetical protein [Deinococcus soli (ex Cha et al. 2016)]|uniref:hypothetical protein n=1 Tax=Deinococcus soli (ex Cha et al. 2016) TaxID=1309411 RepID=UPI00166D5A8B|nr:hypothetical protein [Deinococcus soli (ex Cha et al. 2016)]GGB69222.1 hypothetical protein GCM10008019_26770 [Deinococcus soli (ex Cha et al. 2016)]
MTHLLYLLIGLALAAWRFGPDVLTALAVTDAQRRPALPELALIAWAALLMTLGWPLWLVWRVLLKAE